MPNPPIPNAPQTRNDPDEPGRGALQRQRAVFLADPTAVAMLESMPGPAVVLNEDRRAVAANQRLHALLGVDPAEIADGPRPGALLRCLHADELPDGCGSTEACQQCGLNAAVHTVVGGVVRADRECRIQSRQAQDGGALDLRAHASAVEIRGQRFIVVGLEDISGEKRRQVLERAFFHDLLNTAGGLQGLAELLAEPETDPDSDLEFRRDLCRLSGQVVDQIITQRQLLAAERGELRPTAKPFDLEMFLEDMVTLYRHHEVAKDRSLMLAMTGPATLHTDATLLGRVVGNLIKNAVEATPAGGTVTVHCTPGADTTSIAVHNPGVIPQHVQLQIFQRSFSTKGGEGRGIGTYSVRLLTEKYLRGRVGFTSLAGEGTRFEIVVPNRLAPAAEG